MGVLVTMTSEVERGLVRALAQTGAASATLTLSLPGLSRPEMPRVSDTPARVGRVLTGAESQFPGGFETKNHGFYQPNNWNSENLISLGQETGCLTQSYREQEPHPGTAVPPAGVL